LDEKGTKEELKCNFKIIRMISIGNKLISSNKYHIPLLKSVKSGDSLKNLIEKFNTNITDGLIEFIEKDCLCGNNTFDLIASVDRHSIMQKTVICKKCGLIQSNPRYSEEAFQDFVESDFYKILYFNGNIEKYTHDKYNISTGLPIYNDLNKVIEVNENTKVLEIVCAGGWNLLPFINNNAEVLGVDFNNKFVDLGKNIGLNLLHGTINDVDDKFDIIILNKSLNLIFEPQKVFGKIFEILSETGVVYINIKNNENFDIDKIKNININYFTPESLNYYISSYGFKRILCGKRIDDTFFSIFEKGKAHINKLKFQKKNLKKSFKDIRKIERKHKMSKIFKRKKNVSTS
jgi:SAM-dependent methyltransferase